MGTSYGRNKGNSMKRFWNKVDIKGPDECWNWLGGLTSGGYGAFWGGWYSCRAHRFSWELTYGPIPYKEKVLHKCDNIKCVNPNHLYIGSHLNNMTDLTYRHPGLPGVIHTKLYSGEVWLIKKIGRKLSAWYIGRMFKVSESTIYRILRTDKILCKEGYYV